MRHFVNIGLLFIFLFIYIRRVCSSIDYTASIIFTFFRLRSSRFFFVPHLCLFDCKQFWLSITIFFGQTICIQKPKKKLLTVKLWVIFVLYFYNLLYNYVRLIDYLKGFRNYRYQKRSCVSIAYKKQQESQFGCFSHSEKKPEIPSINANQNNSNQIHRILIYLFTTNNKNQSYTINFLKAHHPHA